jgi:hypothetical protein
VGSDRPILFGAVTQRKARGRVRIKLESISGYPPPARTGATSAGQVAVSAVGTPRPDCGKTGWSVGVIAKGLMSLFDTPIQPSESRLGVTKSATAPLQQFGDRDLQKNFGNLRITSLLIIVPIFSGLPAEVCPELIAGSGIRSYSA